MLQRETSTSMLQAGTYLVQGPDVHGIESCSVRKRPLSFWANPAERFPGTHIICIAETIQKIEEIPDTGGVHRLNIKGSITSSQEPFAFSFPDGYNPVRQQGYIVISRTEERP